MASRHTSPERASRNLSPTFRKAVREEKGCVCANCGSAERIEYHHIVPISLGGTDSPGNMVALCHVCHVAAHRGRHISDVYKGAHLGGRPPKCSDEEAFKALDLLVAGAIGNKRCGELMSLSSSTKPMMTAQYKRYTTERGIRKMRSNLDVSLTLCPWNVHEGYVVGFVEYEDGRREDILFHDTGDNDGTEYDFFERGKIRSGERVTLTWGEFKKDPSVCGEGPEQPEPKRRKRASFEEYRFKSKTKAV